MLQDLVDILLYANVLVYVWNSAQIWKNKIEINELHDVRFPKKTYNYSKNFPNFWKKNYNKNLMHFLFPLLEIFKKYFGLLYFELSCIFDKVPDNSLRAVLDLQHHRRIWCSTRMYFIAKAMPAPNGCCASTIPLPP